MAPSNIGERLAACEARMADIERRVGSLEDISIETKLAEANGNIDKIAELQKTHLEWHNKQSEKSFNWFNAVLGILMLAVAILSAISAFKK